MISTTQDIPLKASQLDLSSDKAQKMRKIMVQTMDRFNMIEDGDRVLVAVSGGKDSSLLLAQLTEIQKRAPFQFHLEAAILDQGHPGFSVFEFQRFIEKDLKVRLHVISKDTYSIVKEKVTSGVYCSLCSRLRRGILYNFAFENQFNKLALGHHRDDLNETLLLNLFYSGKLATMPPKLKSKDGRNIVIRPLAGVAEKDLKELSQDWQIPIIPCNLCGSQDGMKRQQVKALLTDLEKKIPHIGSSMFGAIGNLAPSQLGDLRYWDFDLNSLDEEIG